jgi:hypothetical protein
MDRRAPIVVMGLPLPLLPWRFSGSAVILKTNQQFCNFHFIRKKKTIGMNIRAFSVTFRSKEHVNIPEHSDLQMRAKALRQTTFRSESSEMKDIL